MSTRTLTLDDRLHDYLLKASVRESGILRRLREETAAMPEHAMQISPEQGQFMALLVKILGAKHCLEVGVFTGYSSLAVAQALPDDGRIIACDIDEDFTAVARRYWEEAGVTDKIELHLAPAIETLDKLIEFDEGQPFDFAFIDADKTSYDAYYERCLRLLRVGGVVAFDNTLWGGKVADEQVDDEDTVALRALNDKLFADERIDLSLVPIGDGLTLCLKR